MSCTWILVHKGDNALGMCEMGHCFASPWGVGAGSTLSPAWRGGPCVPSTPPAQAGISPSVLYFFCIKAHTHPQSPARWVFTLCNQHPAQDREHSKSPKPSCNALPNITLIFGQPFLLIPASCTQPASSTVAMPASPQA